MFWSDVRKAYPDQWLIIEALEAYTEDHRRLLDRIAFHCCSKKSLDSQFRLRYDLVVREE